VSDRIVLASTKCERRTKIATYSDSDVACDSPKRVIAEMNLLATYTESFWGIAFYFAG